MTGPISFPTISGPQLAPARRSSIDGLAELLVGISQHRQQLALQREGLELERQRTEASVAASGEQAKESAANRKQKQLEFEQKQQALEAADIAETEIGNMLQLGGVTPERMNEARSKMLERAKGTKLPPTMLLGALDNAVQRNEQTFGAIAQRKASEIDAKVKGETADPTIATVKTQAERAVVDLRRAGVELETSKIQKSLAEVEQTYGAARGGIAGAVLQGGGTLGQAYRIIGVPIPPGIDPNFTVAAKAGSTEQQRKLEGTAGLVAFGNSEIESAGDPDISRFGAIIRRGGTMGSLLEILASSRLDPKEKRAIAGYRMLGEGFALYVTGQQAANTQIERLIGVISKQPGDNAESATNRAFLRQAVVEMIQNAAAGGSGAEGMQRIYDEAKQRGMDARTLGVLKTFTVDAKKYETTKRAREQSAAPADGVRGDPVISGVFRSPPPAR